MDRPETRADLDKIGKRWMMRIRDSEKREEEWRTDATEAEHIYLCTEDGPNNPHFNILHSNVETIVPSLINSSPNPDIRSRFAVEQQELQKPVKDVAEIIERTILTMTDDDALQGEIEGSAQDAFVAGRGVVRIKFDSDDVMGPVADEYGMPTIDEDGQPVVEVVGQENHRLVYEVVNWDDYRQGPSKRWPAPWTAYRSEISLSERERLEAEDFAEIYAATSPDRETSEDLTESVWQIWDMESRKLFFVIEETERLIQIKDDPFGLKGFYPHGKPVQPITSTKNLTPSCPYKVYTRLAKELDTTTRRINALTKGLKAKAIAAGGSEDIKRLAEADDNEIVVAADLENLAATGGLDKAIAWWPIDAIIQVLRELYVQREQTKQAIYEVTGISDIVRGASRSNETATAQQIKAEWGGLRVKKLQQLIQRQVRDLFVISAEIISKPFFGRDTLTKLTGIPITPEMDAILRDPMQHYRIDVETDSTIRADLTKSRTEMSEFLRGTAEFFSTMAPVVQGAPQAAAPLAKMYAAFASQFNLGKSAEDALDQFVMMAEQAAQQPQPNPEAEKMKAEMQQWMEEFKLKMGEFQLKQGELQLKGRKQQLDEAVAANDAQDKGQRLQLDEGKAEVEAAAKFAEIGLEKTQERPVRIGN